MTAPEPGWVALGLSFSLLAHSGRRTPVDLSPSPSYRPGWGLPWMVGHEQTAAWVLCGAPSPFAPGVRGRWVIAPMIDLVVAQWRDVRLGDELRAFEGSKMVGVGEVRWIRDLRSPTPGGTSLERLRAWVDGGAEPPTRV